MAVKWGPLALVRLCWMVLFLGLFSTLVAAAKSTKATILIISRDMESAKAGHVGLQGYAIPYRVLVVPQAGATLPRLSAAVNQGNFGGIVVLGDVAYDYGNGQFKSALTDPQWDELYAYQKAFNVRMVRLDVYPGPKFGMENNNNILFKQTILTKE
jgi:hypothetical protein